MANVTALPPATFQAFEQQYNHEKGLGPHYGNGLTMGDMQHGPINGFAHAHPQFHGNPFGWPNQGNGDLIGRMQLVNPHIPQEVNPNTPQGPSFIPRPRYY